MITPDWHCISKPKNLFELVRTEDMASLNACFPVKEIKLIAADGATRCMREVIDTMDDETFAKWMGLSFCNLRTSGLDRSIAPYFEHYPEELTIHLVGYRRHLLKQKALRIGCFSC